jgi:hypothetical protein
MRALRVRPDHSFLDFGEADVSMAVLRASEKFDGFAIPGLSIRTVAGFAEVPERKEILVAGGCNHPNLLVLPFRLSFARLPATSKLRNSC